MSDPLHIRSADDYVFQLEVSDGDRFKGPMDLLLHLIEREELPITAISLTQVTAQYLEHLAALEQMQPDSIAEFLVMAARLLYIKSRALLPAVVDEEAEDEEEDPAEALARQLREYKLFKERAQWLRSLEKAGKRGYIRLAPPATPQVRLEPGSADVQALLDAVLDILEDIDAPPRPVHTIAQLKITVDERMADLKSQLQRLRQLHFRQFISGAQTRMEVIVSLMAVLEMIKLNQVQVQQEGVFGDIMIEMKEEVVG
ncbi:MAG: segregation/condensation protein A [Chloroflexi bacterium]|nr:segregation/condensation protein A [Chloroflexota bacterium]